METKIFFTISIIFFNLVGHVISETSSSSSSSSLCNGSVGGCSKVVEKDEMTVVMESWSSQRLMEEQVHKLSYGTLRRNQPACDGGNRGEPYTNKCLPKASNPYSRGCPKIYRCRSDS
ncbi:hypothetical protein EUTSA_v10026595mg [Eutrema salsugineum]|uniref:Rapid alkalinization factor 1 n=1 Tax=Eutrema salsugineum TaxID=72664 RepID=V4ML68_EUTSA|nr:protein RALF-like 32 [Eutrema salsugineum]ESQ56277.1 hypothetical protein EUTSA_v10026595mg [Eutrema salsugineum]